MLDLLIGLCYFAGICVMSALAIDIGIMAYHRATGSVTAQKVLEHMVDSNRETIKSMRNTINAQQSEIRIHKKRLAEIEDELGKTTNALKEAQEGAKRGSVRKRDSKDPGTGTGSAKQ